MTNHITGAAGTDPRHTFLIPAEVFARYRWGRTKGYQMLKSAGFPPPIGGSYRLDTLTTWEEQVLAGVVLAAAATDTTDCAETAADTATQTSAAPAPDAPIRDLPAAAAGRAGTRAGSADLGPAHAEVTWTPATRRPARASQKGGR